MFPWAPEDLLKLLVAEDRIVDREYLGRVSKVSPVNGLYK